jgi:hypothetical protein
MVVVGFLAGIMRRFSKELAASAAAGVEDSGDLSASDAAQEGEGNEAAAVGETHESRRERKRKEQMEIQAILEEEGVLDELEGKQVGVTIQAVNMSLDCDCSATGGWAGETDWKSHHWRHTSLCRACVRAIHFHAEPEVSRETDPGTAKKGKTAKHAVDVFVSSKECSPQEKALIKGLTDPEMVAIMIGDVKLSVPGLFSTLKNKKNEKKNSKKTKNAS